MDILKILEIYPVPTYLVSGILIAWAFSKFIAPNIPMLQKVVTGKRDKQITSLVKRVSELERKQNSLEKELRLSHKKENRLLGLLSGLKHQLHGLEIDIGPEIEEIKNLK